ncbi:MAG: hypothetical protein ABI813_09885 [Bacteroidota bacterium]
MKKYLLIVLLMLGVLWKSTAQVQERDGRRLEALKVAWLTKKLDLSPDEAQRFWPIYNNYTQEIRDIRQDQRQQNLPEIEVEEKILTVRKKYNVEFGKALSQEKVNTFFRSEKDFGNEIRKELQQRRMNRQNKRGLR